MGFKEVNVGTACVAAWAMQSLLIEILDMGAHMGCCAIIRTFARVAAHVLR